MTWVIAICGTMGSGKSTLTEEQTQKLRKHNINIVETEVEKLEHVNGNLQHIIFKDGKKTPIKAVYARSAFAQHCSIPELLGCDLTEEGYLKVDALQKTSVEGVFASGDNSNRMRTVANAVATGTTAGMIVNKEMVLEEFD